MITLRNRHAKEPKERGHQECHQESAERHGDRQQHHPSCLALEHAERLYPGDPSMDRAVDPSLGAITRSAICGRCASHDAQAKRTRDMARAKT